MDVRAGEGREGGGGLFGFHHHGRDCSKFTTGVEEIVSTTKEEVV